MEVKDIRTILGNAELNLSAMDRPRLEALCNSLVQGLLEIYPTLEEETAQAALLAQQSEVIQTMGKSLAGLNKVSTRLARRTTLDEAVLEAETARLKAEGESLAYESTLTDILDRATRLRFEDEADYPSFVSDVISLITEATGTAEEEEEEDIDEPVMAHLPYCSVPADVPPAECPVCASIPPDKRQEIIDRWEDEQEALRAEAAELDESDEGLMVEADESEQEDAEDGPLPTGVGNMEAPTGES